MRVNISRLKKKVLHLTIKYNVMLEAKDKEIAELNARLRRILGPKDERRTPETKEEFQLILDKDHALINEQRKQISKLTHKSNNLEQKLKSKKGLKNETNS